MYIYYVAYQCQTSKGIITGRTAIESKPVTDLEVVGSMEQLIAKELSEQLQTIVSPLRVSALNWRRFEQEGDDG